MKESTGQFLNKNVQFHLYSWQFGQTNFAFIKLSHARRKEKEENNVPVRVYQHKDQEHKGS